MKISAFHLMPYRDLADDFEQKHKSAWFTLPFHSVADPRKIPQYYNWTLDELLFAAKAGFDGVCTNEHHQNAYGFMVNPNMIGAVLARSTRELGLHTAIVQMGATAAFLNPPIRVAEEYAMLDCLSEGRLIAGFPIGLGGDFAYSYGHAPSSQRERYQEAHDLITKAWAAKEIFAWNGRYYQLPMVNIWPRPVQEPRPRSGRRNPGDGSGRLTTRAGEVAVTGCGAGHRRGGEPVARARGRRGGGHRRGKISPPSSPARRPDAGWPRRSDAPRHVPSIPSGS